ncbi:hypothetical protein RQP46_007878 [Phenoliferia psychrophenolica]
MAGWSTDTAHPPNAFLLEAQLYVGGVLEAVPDERIVEALSECLRLRPVIERRTGSATAEATGYIEFESIEKAEKAYATANPAWLADYNCSLTLHLSPPSPSSPPEPTPRATVRVVKMLPLDTTAGALFDLCRPFGPIHRCVLHYAAAFPPGSGPAEFKGQAYVTYYDESHAQTATEELHCVDFGGSTIIVQPYRAPRKSDQQQQQSKWASTPAFVPLGQPPHLNAVAPAWSPSQRSFSGTSQSSIHSQPSFLPPHIQQVPSTGAAIDPCNLFIKSIDPSVTSQDLFEAFKSFGKIVSARVMRNDATGQSKEFGFVSFTTPIEAHAALRGMDGQMVVGSTGEGKPVVVRLHEPKKFREGRLRARYSSNGDEEIDGRFQGLSVGAESPLQSPSGSVYAPNESYPSSSPEPSQQSPLPSISPPITPLSEQDRLLAAVRKLEPSQASEIVELLMGLPKKERAMCLFNPEHLKSKIADALIILTPDSDPEPSPPPKPSATASLPTPATSPRATKTAVPPMPASFADLARLPAVDFVALVRNRDLSSLGVERISREKEDDTDAFMDALDGKAVADVKQKLGDRVFKVVKALGVKGAPKITIQLLDSEDLRALAHLADYPLVVKERIPAPSSSSK